MRSLSVHAKCTSAPGPWRQMTAKQTASVGCYELPFCDAGHIWPSQIVGEPGKITVRRSPALNPACYLQSVATVCRSFIPRGVSFWRQINILPAFFNYYVKGVSETRRVSAVAKICPLSLNADPGPTTKREQIYFSIFRPLLSGIGQNSFEK